MIPYEWTTSPLSRRIFRHTGNVGLGTFCLMVFFSIWWQAFETYPVKHHIWVIGVIGISLGVQMITGDWRDRQRWMGLFSFHTGLVYTSLIFYAPYEIDVSVDIVPLEAHVVTVDYVPLLVSHSMALLWAPVVVLLTAAFIWLDKARE